jgi:hypothetical protein
MVAITERRQRWRWNISIVPRQDRTPRSFSVSSRYCPIEGAQETSTLTTRRSANDGDPWQVWPPRLFHMGLVGSCYAADGPGG